MSIRPSSGPDPLPIESMEDDDIPEVVREFCDRHQDRPELAAFDDESGAMFIIPTTPPATFVFQMTCRSVRFSNGVDFTHGEEGKERITAVIEALAAGVAFGVLRATDDGAQWDWDAPAMHYPYFQGISMHAIAYAEYLSDQLWDILRQVSQGEIEVETAIAIAREPTNE